MEKQHDSIGKDVVFLHAGCEVRGKVTHYKPDGPDSAYIYKTIDKFGIKYLITKPNFVRFIEK